MSKVRSVRLNTKVEHMFNVVKAYCEKRGGISDSEIFVNGIQMQYEQVAETLNESFVSFMKRELQDKPQTIELFEKLCDLLEVLSVSQGTILSEEFNDFLLVIVNEAQVYGIDEEYGRDSKSQQYSKVYEKLLIFGKDQDEVFDKICYIDCAFHKYLEWKV